MKAALYSDIKKFVFCHVIPKFIFLFLVVIFFFTSYASVSEPISNNCEKASAAAKLHTFSSSIVMIIVPTIDGQQIQVTGFKIGHDLIATVRHLFTDLKNDQLKATKVLPGLLTINRLLALEQKGLAIKKIWGINNKKTINNEQDWLILKVDRSKSNTEILKKFDLAPAIPLLEYWPSDSRIETLGYSSLCDNEEIAKLTLHKGTITPIYLHKYLSWTDIIALFFNKKISYELNLQANISFGFSGAPVIVLDSISNKPLGAVGVFRGEFQIGNSKQISGYIFTPLKNIQDIIKFMHNE